MIDWAFWGVIIGIIAIVVGAAVAIVIYLRGKAKSVTVSATFDRSGSVQVLIEKTGTPTVHVRDVKLLQAGTKKTLKIRSRHPAGEFDISAAGKTAYDCFCLLDNNKSADDGVEVQVWLAAKVKRQATAMRSEQAIKLPDGVTLGQRSWPSR
jgi:hypothetical protein